MYVKSSKLNSLQSSNKVSSCHFRLNCLQWDKAAVFRFFAVWTSSSHHKLCLKTISYCYGMLVQQTRFKRSSNVLESESSIFLSKLQMCSVVTVECHLTVCIKIVSCHFRQLNQPQSHWHQVKCPNLIRNQNQSTPISTSSCSASPWNHHHFVQCALQTKLNAIIVQILPLYSLCQNGF